MATVKKQGSGYKITVSCGYDLVGKQIRKHLTWAPDPGMTARQEAKELQRQVVLFEEKCKTGQFLDGSIRFAEFADEWMEKYAKNQLRPKTLSRYQAMLPRINAAIGNVKLDKLQPHHLMELYSNLSESGIRDDSKCRFRGDFNAMITDQGLTKTSLAKRAGVSPPVLSSLAQGKNISTESAQKISSALGVKIPQLFHSIKTDAGLSQKTILHHHRLISSILSAAVKWQVIFSNPCDRVEAPKPERKEAKYLDDVQAARLMESLSGESEQRQTIISMLLYTGLRRGELCGLEWSDIDFNTSVITVQRSSLYLPEKGVFTDETKNSSSMRSIKVSSEVIKTLKRHKAWQREQAFQLGDQWKNSNRLFTSQDGDPINPDTITSWFHKFIQKNDLPDISIHSLRHTNATLMIAAGTNLQTIAHRLGHSNVITTGKIYSHAIESADAAAAETLQDILGARQKRTANTK